MTQGSQSCYRSIGVVGAVRSERVGTLPPEKIPFKKLYFETNKELQGYTPQISLQWAEAELLRLV
jgi:hypothetical protein